MKLKRPSRTGFCGLHNDTSIKKICIDFVRTLYYNLIMEFIYDEKKNQILFKTRGITFEQVIEVISEKGVLLDFEHPNKKDYSNQRLMVIDVNDYPHCIPYVMDGNKYVLKTIFKDRRFKYLLEANNEER